jgi:glycosyltransferase involved in cell wall biosynthesis
VKFFPHLLQEKFDIIDVSVFPYFSCFTVKFATIMKNTPSVLTWHEVWGDYWYEYLGRAGFFGKLVEKAVSKFSQKNIAVSTWTKKRLEALEVSEEKITVVPNGIDLERISKIEPEGSRTSSGLDRKVYDVIFAGRLIKEKNVDVLIKAIALSKANSPNIKCCVVGDGPEREVLVRLSDELGIRENVDFVGFQEHETLIAKIKASKVLVLPSSREGFGMVVIEAFACGVPVITVREKYNAAQGLVENEINGLIVELEDREIAKSIERLIVEDSNYKKMSEAALQKAKKYDWDEIVTQLENYYEDLA